MIGPIDKTYTFSWRSELERAIEVETSIPGNAKQAVKDFVLEKLGEIKDFVGDLLDFPVSESIDQYWPVVVEILKGLGLG